MKTQTDKTTASATPDKVRRIRLTPQRVAELEKLAGKRTSDQLAAARSHLPDIDATLEAMRTIPAEKPTAIKINQPYVPDYKAHAAQLAEALRGIVFRAQAINDERFDKQAEMIQCEAEKALAEYEAAQ